MDEKVSNMKEKVSKEIETAWGSGGGNWSDRVEKLNDLN